MDDRHQAVWKAHLSNGLTIIQDDSRPGIDENSAWIRLGQYCRENNVKIDKFWLEYRSNRADELPMNAEGYFFSKYVLKALFTDVCLYAYMVGYLDGDKVHIIRYSTPELICFEQLTREVSEDMRECLIRNNHGDNEYTI